jgi:single-stranded-DNA-specific exonuclease
MPDSIFLEKSLMQAAWRMPDIGLDMVEQIVRKYDLPEIVARLLISRGIEHDKVESYLKPTLKNDFPDPFSLEGMDAAANYLAKAITDKKKIAIFGDFDVDGATSSALLFRFLKHFGIDAPIFIPDRLTEGYGPNVEAFKQMKEQGIKIAILLDCGTTAFDTIQAGADLGLEIMVIDHHEAEEKLPAAVHVINPKRKDDISGLAMLCACGVTFMLCVAVNNKLRAIKQCPPSQSSPPAGREDKGGGEPPLKDWLDLVALGTVCDMVPLTGVNRLFVKAGFEQMARRKNPGISALLDVAKVNSAPNTYTAGFVLGPRINAGSRVHKSNLGALLLSTDDPEEAKNTAWLLNDCNEKRKNIQVAMEESAVNKVEDFGLDTHPVIIVDDKDWHPGLSGLVAGRLKDKYGKPAIVITYGEDGEARGSGRSVAGIHIAQAFIDARNAGLLEKGGGHAMAGGFTVKPDQLETFRAFLHDHIGRQAKSAEANVQTWIDGLLTVRGVRSDLVKTIQNHIGPFGQEHPEPLFLLQNVRLHAVDVMAGAHIRAQVADWEGGPRMKAVSFRSVGTELGDALLKQGKQPFHLLGYLKLDTWNGREQPEFHIKDAAFAMEEAKKAG